MTRTWWWPALGLLACGRSTPSSTGAAGPVEEPPVALNAEPTVQYPTDLYDQHTEGDVELRLFVDSTGRLVPESTRVTEPSGYAAFDSAAVRGAARLHYAPARRHGVPVATSFLQTIEFRHPGSAGLGPVSPPASLPESVRVSRPVPPAPLRARPDSARPRPDSSRSGADTVSPPRDSSTAKPDSSGAAAH